MHRALCALLVTACVPSAAPDDNDPLRDVILLTPGADLLDDRPPIPEQLHVIAVRGGLYELIDGACARPFPPVNLDLDLLDLRTEEPVIIGLPDDEVARCDEMEIKSATLDLACDVDVAFDVTVAVFRDQDRVSIALRYGLPSFPRSTPPCVWHYDGMIVDGEIAP